MMDEQYHEKLLVFFKALADANRLRIVGLLANNELSVEQMAEILNLRPSTVSHHLTRLSEAGLVSARAESYYNIYSLETASLERMAETLLARENLSAAASGVNMDAYDAKVVRDFSLPDGRLKSIPSQQKKLDAILRYVAGSFEPGRKYSEKEVNEILSRYHQDTAMLRRSLVDFKYMVREAGGASYWLADISS